MNTFTDYYTLLGVTPDAPPEKIKVAFKKLALQYHPDVYKGVDANERMSQLLQAYQTLNDPVARKNYDLQRAEHTLDGHVHDYTSTVASHTSREYSRSSQGPVKPAGKTISPGARRDRQRHYDFPSFAPDKTVRIHLGDIDYALSASQTQQLVRDGLLRGVAARTKGQQYFCHRCHHHWNDEQESYGAKKLPHFCPKCHVTDWSEYLLLRCMHCCAVFESEQIRYEIGSYFYAQRNVPDKTGLCPPYELFPLCPYCGTARWSQSENARVSGLRKKADQQALMRRLIWISIVVIGLLLVGLLLFRGH